MLVYYVIKIWKIKIICNTLKFDREVNQINRHVVNNNEEQLRRYEKHTETLVAEMDKRAIDSERRLKAELNMIYQNNEDKRHQSIELKDKQLKASIVKASSKSKESKAGEDLENDFPDFEEVWEVFSWTFVCSFFLIYHYFEFKKYSGIDFKKVQEYRELGVTKFTLKGKPGILNSGFICFNLKNILNQILIIN